ERCMIPSWVALTLKDTYGYTVMDPSAMPNFQIQQTSSGGLRIWGGLGSTITVDQVPLFPFLSVNVGDRSPGTGADPNPSYTQLFITATVTGITIVGGSTSDTVNLRYTPSKVTTTFASPATDSVNLGANGSVQSLLGPITFSDPKVAAFITV